MATTGKTIATIGYNTEAFLARRLQELHAAGIIDRYMYIYHDKDIDDDTGEIKKKHYHLWIQPGKKVDTMELQKELTEIQMDGSKPLRCLSFKPSNVKHWLRYVVHDKQYLAIYGKDDTDGKQEYTISDIRTNSPEELDMDWTDSATVLKPSKDQQLDAIVSEIHRKQARTSYSDIYDFAVQSGYRDAALAYHQQIRAIISDHNAAYDSSNVYDIQRQITAGYQAENEVLRQAIDRKNDNYPW